MSQVASDRIVTVPNLISLLRIALIPVFVVLIVDHDTSSAVRSRCGRRC
jgi:phosphatidylglycerophosphate synthase